MLRNVPLYVSFSTNFYLTFIKTDATSLLFYILGLTQLFNHGNDCLLRA
jgi:hypothetical protein